MKLGIEYNFQSIITTKLHSYKLNYQLYQNNKKFEKALMGFKANIDISLSFSNLKICSVRQQGRIKFRICLYYTIPTSQHKNFVQQLHYCHPYSILKKSSQQKNMIAHKSFQSVNNPYGQKHKANYYPFVFPIEESQIDMNSDYYISKPYKIMFERQYHSILQTCCFRAYIDIQKYQQMNLKCQVQLMFCPNAVTQQAAIFKTIGKCECKIRKLFDVSTFLPIVFDQFEGVVIQGVYQAALIDFRYERDLNQPNPASNPQNFHQYLRKTTNGFNRIELKNFYRYYRELLQKQLFTIQERHYDLARVLGLSSSHQEFRILRVNPNPKIQLMIQNLTGYNSYRNTYSIAQKKYMQNQSFQTISSVQQISAKSNKVLSNRNNNPSYHITQNYKMEISQQIIHDFLAIKAHLYKKWSEFIEFTTKYVGLITQKYRTNYNALVKERLSGNVFSHRVNVSDWRKSAYEDSGNVHLRQAQIQRKKVQKDEQLWKEAFLVETQGFFAKDSKNIKIFQQIYPISHRNTSIKSQKSLIKRRSNQKNSQQKKSLDKKSLQKQKKNYNIYHQNQNGVTPNQKRSLTNIQSTLFEHSNRLTGFPYNGIKVIKEQLEGVEKMISSTGAVETQYDCQDHFIVLVHGFQASRQDFIVLKNCLQIRFKCKVFISVSNQGRTDDDIQSQGKRLAIQLQKYLNDSSPSLNYKLSFVGHSMGGIIIRTALCYLQNIDQHLHSYVSFSTPHLGYLYQPQTHIQAGLWLIGTWQKTLSIEQICVRQKQNLRQSFLYRLSKSKTLDNFKNLAFVGSCQDKYVPYESSLLQYNRHAIDNISTQNGKIISQMIDGLLGTVLCKQISRIDVIFNIQESNFDSMIGRTAHIKYLSDRQFIKVFCIVFDKFFK